MVEHEGRGLVRLVIGELCRRSYRTSKDKGFHSDVDGIEDDHVVKGFMRTALIHTEVSEITEELRHDPVNWDNVSDECADVLIRVFDLAQLYQLDLAEALLNKMDKNDSRPYKHGKAY